MIYIIKQAGLYQNKVNSSLVSNCKCKMGYRAFLLTWPASMQIYWNKRKRLHKKRVNSRRIDLEHQNGRHFIVLGQQYGRRDVM